MHNDKTALPVCIWGAQAASLWLSAACRQQRTRRAFSASCRKGQASSLCSPKLNNPLAFRSATEYMSIVYEIN